MATTPPAPLGPSEHHQRLLEKVGDWQVDCQYFFGGESMRAEGTDHVTAIGSYWTTALFHCEVTNDPISGLATMGFDPIKNKYVSTWQDSKTPYLYYFEGGFEDDTTLVMEGDNIDPTSGKMVNYKSIEILGKDERSLQLFIELPDSEPLRILEYRYTRV